jgi:hypothetical protein
MGMGFTPSCIALEEGYVEVDEQMPETYGRRDRRRVNARGTRDSGKEHCNELSAAGRAD